MALSFEESKKLLSQQVEQPAVMSLSIDDNITADENYGIATADEYTGDMGQVAAYSVWTKSNKYLWLDQYADNKTSYVNENKDITVDETQINITQESNSQYIPFEMPRYYDGFDLMGTVLSIHYVTSDGYVGASKPVNVSYDESTIRFAWLVDDKATHIAGQLQFEIRATGVNENGDVYVWKSKPSAQLNVLQSLIDDSDIILDYLWVEDLATRVAENVAEQIADVQIAEQVETAQAAAEHAQASADAAAEIADNMEASVDTKISSALENYYTKLESYNRQEVDGLLHELDMTDEINEVNQKIDNLDGLANFGVEYDGATMTFKNGEAVMDTIEINSDPSVEWTTAYTATVEEKIATAKTEVQDDVNGVRTELDNYKETVGADLESIHSAIDGLPETLESDYYTKTASDGKFATKADLNTTNTNVSGLSSSITTNANSITSLNKSVEEINQSLAGIDKSPRVTYEATYGDVEMDDGTTAEYMFTLWETEGTNQPTVKSRFQIMGGGGGISSSVSRKIAYVEGYQTPIVATVNDPVIVKYEFSGEDSAGDTNLDGTASWKIGNRVVATQDVATGECEFDLTKYVNVGDNKVLLTITHATGAIATKSWTIKVVDVRLESSFDDTKKHQAGSAVNFTFTPYGGVDKTVHFLLDGKEIATKQSSAAAAGLSDSYAIPAQEHGTHLFEIYMTAEINKNTVESNHIVKDIIWYDEAADVPVIGCVQQEFTARQYEAVNITYTAYDPSTETPNVVLKSTYVNEDGETVEEYSSNLVLTSNTGIWQYKTDVIGEHTLTITCGETVKTLIATITELGISINPITAGLAFDFNPVGYSNSDQNRLWSSGDIAMSVSENFDWVNGGYQIDDNGDQCFCIKAGTSAEINYELFGDDAKVNGKQMKLIFKTENVADTDAVFMSCVSQSSAGDNIGIIMKAHEATIYASADKDKLPLPYAEEEIIEFEFNITPSTDSPSMIMGYEDGVSTRPFVYNSTHNFQQQVGSRKVITLGSADCDLYIYRFKVYKNSLSDRDILNNFIADARSAEEMIARYDRNQIYKEGILDPDYLAEVCPQLRIIKIETPYFTSDKDEKIGRVTSEQTGEVLMTNVECIYKGGDPILDNWVATDVVHSGQGTSSNNYGPAGRNLDIIMKRYKDKKTGQYLNESPIITLSDNTQVSKVSLTRNSVDVNYFNIKVNIASSENANNALLAKRYNQYNPYQRPIVRPADTLEDHYTSEEIAQMTEDQKSKIIAGYQAEADALASYVKDTMEFQNCVIFVKESDPNLATHREFNDNNWHFYAIGNIGDSKKTDDTRLTDPTDPYECILEVMDNELPNSTMPTGVVDENGAPVYPISAEQWVAGNSAYDALYGDLFDESKSDDKENGLADTYGWRYIYEDGTDEQNAEYRAYVENKWREFYTFVVTATDEEFKAHLGDYCVLNSVLYYYLFTLRYTMTDNHAKNSFWHYGKSNDLDSDGNPIRKWDLCFDYDNDTALGIDNYGRMTYRYGYEEIDYVDGTKDWVWNAPQHVFFLRLRELFDEELSALYNVLPADCWSATSLINQFNDWQMQFPEELWRVDIERKYIRTYTGSYVNGPAYPEFLTERANGRKKTQRAQFEKNQEKYMASKFGSTVAAADDIILRCSVPNTTLAVPAKFDMHLTPYSYMYLNVKYNTSPPIRVRAVPNNEYTIEYTGEVADIIEIYSASCLKSVGDLSACYLTNGTFANATKIRELVLGNGTEGYNNTNVMTLGLGSNGLLNKLDIQNMSGLTHSLDLSGLKNLEELYAFGSGVSGVVFADGGNIKIVEIPDVGSLTMKNLSYLTDDNFAVSSYDKLSKLVAENSLLDILELLNNSKNLYQVRLVGINWTLEDTSLLERLYALAGVNNTGGNADRSVLAGYVHVPVVREQQLREYNAAWTDLEIAYNTLVQQFTVTFVNDDGTVLDVQYVDKGTKAVDPITRAENPIPTPTKESSVSTDYTFAGWDKQFVDAFDNQIITATYSEAIREYTVKYVSKGTVLQETVAPYGTSVLYEGETPTYTLEESAYRYYLFDGWDQGGYVSGDKTINAVFDSCEYKDGYFNNKDISEMRLVEIYMMLQLSKANVVNINNIVEAKDSISICLGNDVSYSDVEDVVLISEETVFDGTNYVDTGIQLLSEDRDFVLVIDYKMDSGNSANAVLAQCFSGLDTSGFKLSYNNGVKLVWGSTSVTPCAVGNREMIVIRHIKGENGLHVYSSNVSGSTSSYVTLDGIHSMVHNVSLVFGCSKLEDGSYEQYGKGTVYWSKLWYADLGAEVCTKLACWPHEEIGFEACFETSGAPKRYYLSDNSGMRSSLTFIASNVLAQPMSMSTASTNAGGWAVYPLNSYLNSRVYDTFPDNWKQLIKQVIVKSSVGNQSTEISDSDCYIFIPSIAELGENKNTEPYSSEGTQISHITNADSRVCDGKYYWTRSPSLGWSSYVYSIIPGGSAQAVTQLSTRHYIRMMISI